MFLECGVGLRTARCVEFCTAQERQCWLCASEGLAIPAMENFYTPVELTQLHAAVEQFETALYLFLLGGSRAAVLTLAGAAQEVLNSFVRKEYRARNIPVVPSFLQQNHHLIDAESPKNVNETRNFLKHGQGDSERTRTVSSSHCQAWLWDCIQSLQTLKLNSTGHLEWLFLMWTINAHQQGVMFDEDADEDFCREVMSELGLHTPYPQVADFTDWLRDYIAAAPALHVPNWVLASVGLARKPRHA